MKGSVWRLLIVACVGALACVGVALAANSGSFADPSSDAGSAPDLSGVTMTNDDSGTVTIKVALANRSAFGLNDGVGVGIDADQNPDTGSLFYGAEYELDLEAGVPKLYRAAADGFFEQAPLPPSFNATFSAGVVTISFKPSELGSSTGFNLYTIGFDDSAIDTAPDIRTVNYQFVGGATPPALSPDQRAPYTHAFKAKGAHGKFVQLNYYVLDGRAETQDTVVISKGKHVLKRLSSTLGDTNPFFFYYARWRVPKKVRGTLKFCITSTDRAGNKSKQSCAALTVK